MPGRVAARRGRPPSSDKPSTQTTKARGSASTRTSAVQVPDEGDDTTLRQQICNVFAAAQRNTATQRKLIVTLRKIQEECCYEPIDPKRKGREDFDEADFNNEVGRCVLRVLPVKRSEPAGDRIIRFLGLFLMHANEKDKILLHGDSPDETDAFGETPSSRLTAHILTIVLQLLAAKDKTVRLRATQIVAFIVNKVDSIDDEQFQLLRLGLLKRLRDKESSVRVHAALGLGRLTDDGDEDEDDDASDDGIAGGVMMKLLDCLQNDPAAEVRRSLLINIPFSAETLPYLLERARDADGATRRALFARLLPSLGDFRHLSLTHREKLLRWGLRDRDEHVRKATARLFRERWIEDCAGSSQPNEDGTPPPPGQVSPPTFEALLELLERIDIVNSGAENGIGHEAMKEFWEGRPDYREFVSFDDDFWSNLTPESSFTVRTLNEYCRNANDNKLTDLIEDKMPEVIKFAFFLQNHLNVLIENVALVASDANEDPDLENDTIAQEFSVEQMLHIALTLDYSDEVGRRKMFAIMREALALPELPEECTRLVVEVLRTTCGSNASGEREFCGIVLEAIAEVHDSIMGEDAADKDFDESFHSARSELSDEDAGPRLKKPKQADSESSEIDEEKAIRKIMVNMKCLHIAQCMLQNVQCDLEQNSHLVTMLNSLIVPAVRSQEAPIRERGLTCLGLCCLLSKNLAEENLTLFLHCFGKGHEALQQIALQVITDVLINHPSLLAVPTAPSHETTASPTKGGPVNALIKPIGKAYLKALSIPLPSGLALNAAIGLSKLLLLKLFPAQTASDLLKSLILSYFAPDTAHNPGLRQALSYFLPVYCHSRRANAVQVARIVVNVIGKLMLVAEEADQEDDEFIGWTTIVGMLAEWTDGRRLVDTGMVRATQTDEDLLEPHVVLAEEILQRTLVTACSKEERKPLLSLLSKLHFPTTGTSSTSTVATAEYLASLQSISELVDQALDARIAPDATTRTALVRIQTSLTKIVGDAQEAGVTPAEGDDEVDGEGEGEADAAEDAPEIDVDDPTVVPAQVENEQPTEVPAAAELPDVDDDAEMGQPHLEGAETIFGDLPEAEGTIMMSTPAPAKRGRGRPRRTTRTVRRSDDSVVESLLSDD